MRLSSFSLRVWIIATVAVAVAIASMAALLRWNHVNSPEYRAAVQQALLTTAFQQIPSQIGVWNDISDPKTDLEWMKTFTIRQVAASRRQYQCQETGETVTCFTFGGSPRDVSFISPTDSYDYSSVSTKDSPYTIRLDGEHDTTFTLRGIRSTALPSLDHLTPKTILWCTTENGEWEAPEYRRFHYQHAKKLFLLLICVEEDPTNPADGSAIEETALRFAEAFLPELNKVLFN